MQDYLLLGDLDNQPHFESTFDNTWCSKAYPVMGQALCDRKRDWSSSRRDVHGDRKKVRRDINQGLAKRRCWHPIKTWTTTSQKRLLPPQDHVLYDVHKKLCSHRQTILRHINKRSRLVSLQQWLSYHINEKCAVASTEQLCVKSRRKELSPQQQVPVRHKP